MRRRLWTAVILHSQLSVAALFYGTTGCYRVTSFFHHEPKKLRMRTAAVKSLRRYGYAHGLLANGLESQAFPIGFTDIAGFQLFREISAMSRQSSGKGSPAAAADLGRREVSVMPGMVLASRT